jgi:hypothetical protein
LSQPVEKIAREDYDRDSDLLAQLGHQERRNINIEETIGQSYKVRVGSPEGGSTLHVSLNHEIGHPGELVEVYARMGKPGAVEGGLFEAVGRLASAFLQYAAEHGEEERVKAEATIVDHLINIQSGYPAFFKFADADKSVVIQSPCDGLAKAIQQYRWWYDKKQGTTTDTNYETVVSVDGPATLMSAMAAVTTGSTSTNSEPTRSTLPSCSKCGSDSYVKIDGCLVCQGCGFSKCG